MPARTINAPRKTAKRKRRPPPHVPIGALRLAAGLSLDALAKRMAAETDCAPGRGTLCAIESGDRGASLDILHALETVFGLPDGMITTSWEPREPRGKSGSAKRGAA
jgi:transcriptional regulator with XRE-family HTH domain